MILKGTYIKLYILFFLVFFYSGIKITFCQETNSGISSGIKEIIRMHTDRNLYIAGERIWFRIYLMTGSPVSPGGFSRVAYVELLDNSNEVISRQKVKTDPSGGEGYLDIPVDISSGYYFIKSYTSWMKNFNPSGYFVSAVAVINPASRLYKYRDTTGMRDTVVESSLLDQDFADDISSGRLQAIPEIIVHNINKEYRRREKVELEVITSDATGDPLSSDLSVSVYYSDDKEFKTPAVQDYLSSYPGINPEVIINPEYQPEHLFIPEVEGPLLSGRIMESSGQNSVPDVPVILSVVGETAFLKSYLTRADGRFYFSLDDLQGEHDIVLSYGNMENELVIYIDEPSSRDFVNLPGMELNLDESWRSFIEKQLLNFRLTSLYTGGGNFLKADSKNLHDSKNLPDSKNLTQSNDLQEPFYVKPDITVRMEDFIRLPNMEEVFRELVKQVLVTKENGTLTLNVLDINTNRPIGPDPFFLLDGVPFFDSGLIFELNPEDIKVVNIVCHKYFKGILEMDGIIDVRTNAASLPVSELPGNYNRRSFQGYQSPQKYINPDYSDEQKLVSRIPDFRNLLYWNPSIRTDKDGRAYISFYTSDNTGGYSISITGISSEGLLQPVSYSFEVLK